MEFKLKCLDRCFWQGICQRVNPLDSFQKINILWFWIFPDMEYLYYESGLHL